MTIKLNKIYACSKVKLKEISLAKKETYVLIYSRNKKIYFESGDVIINDENGEDLISIEKIRIF